MQLQPMSPALTPCVYYVSARGLDRITVMIRYILGTTWPYIKEDEMCGTVNNNVSLLVKRIIKIIKIVRKSFLIFKIKTIDKRIHVFRNTVFPLVTCISLAVGQPFYTTETPLAWPAMSTTTVSQASPPTCFPLMSRTCSGLGNLHGQTKCG